MRRALVRVLLGLAVLIVLAAAYVQLTYRRDFSATPYPKITARKDVLTLARGEYVVHAVAHCSACHGAAEAVDRHELPADLKDLSGGHHFAAGPFGDFYAANLTSDPETGIGRLSDEQVARAIRHGVSPDGHLDPFMSFAAGPMADEDLSAVVSYLRMLPPVKRSVPRDSWGILAKLLSSELEPRMDSGPRHEIEGEPSVERGNYLANGPAFCFGCHSPVDPARGMKISGRRFSGANEPDRDPTDPAYEIIAPNLTPDPETGILATFTEEAFVERFQKTDRVHKGSKMPWESFRRMHESDLRSIFRYLRTLPPARHATGPSRRAR